MTEIKICGLTRPEDARLAEQAGADYLGIVFAPSPRRRDADAARGIWRGTTARRVGVFADASKSYMIDHASRLGLNVLQLHGSETPELCSRLRSGGDWWVWKAIRVTRRTSILDELERFRGCVDGLQLEGWSRMGSGGVGARFDWSRAARLRDAWPAEVALILAGGLRADNVAEAIARVEPDIVDVSSGVEYAPGRKDAAAIRAFVEAVRLVGREKGSAE